VNSRVRVSNQRSRTPAGDCRYHSPPREPEHAPDLLGVPLGREPAKDRTRSSSPPPDATRRVELIAQPRR
jgi:hypothetical protein